MSTDPWYDLELRALSDLTDPAQEQRTAAEDAAAGTESPQDETEAPPAPPA